MVGAVLRMMKRLVHHMFLGLLVFGLLGPMTARAWYVVAQASLIEEEHEFQKECALFHRAPRLVAWGRGRSRRASRRARSVRRPVARVRLPAQALRPRVAVVWRPLRLGSADDDLQG